MLYLEEDCDAPMLLDALSRSTDALPKYSMDRHTDGKSRVKSLPPFFQEFHHTVCNRWASTNFTLNRIEEYCRNIRPSYNVPRPSEMFPWNYELFLEVLDGVREWLRDNTGHCVFWTKEGDLIVTNSDAHAETHYQATALQFQPKQ